MSGLALNALFSTLVGFLARAQGEISSTSIRSVPLDPKGYPQALDDEEGA